MILAWIFIGLGLLGLLFVINFCVKMHNWKMQGYKGTYKALVNGRLGKVEDPKEMTFISIENKMYHIGAWEAYRDFRNIFNDDDGEY